jgi:hypothetical protein
MSNLYVEELPKSDLRRKRKNWAILAIAMFLIGIVIGHLLSSCMFRTNIYEEETGKMYGKRLLS